MFLMIEPAICRRMNQSVLERSTFSFFLSLSLSPCPILSERSGEEDFSLFSLPLDRPLKRSVESDCGGHRHQVRESREREREREKLQTHKWLFAWHPFIEPSVSVTGRLMMMILVINTNTLTETLWCRLPESDPSHHLLACLTLVLHLVSCLAKAAKNGEKEETEREKEKEKEREEEESMRQGKCDKWYIGTFHLVLFGRWPVA